jgi:serine/threonine protein kinase
MGNRGSTSEASASKIAPDRPSQGGRESQAGEVTKASPPPAQGQDGGTTPVVPNGDGDHKASTKPPAAPEANGKASNAQAATAPSPSAPQATPSTKEDEKEKPAPAAAAAPAAAPAPAAPERPPGEPTVIWNHSCVMPKRYSQMKVTRQQQWAIPESFGKTWTLANVGDVNHVMRHYEGTLEPIDSSQQLCGMFGYVISDIAKQRYEKSCFHITWHLAEARGDADPQPRLFFMDRLDDLKELKESPYVQKVLQVATSDWRIFVAVERAEAGTLSHLIDQHETIDELPCAKIFREVFKGMAFLAERRVVHRNMTTTSIMLMDQDPLDVDQVHAKIGDFAHAIMLNLGQTWHILPERERSPKRIPVGDPHIWSWSAANFGWGITSDAWAVGICLHEALLGAFPLMVHKKLEGTRIRLRDFNGPQLEPSDMSTEAHDVLLGLLHKSSQERWTMAQCVNSPWVKDPTACIENHEKQHGPIKKKAVDKEMAKMRQSQVRQSQFHGNEGSGGMVGNAMNAIRKSMGGGS